MLNARFSAFDPTRTSAVTRRGASEATRAPFQRASVRQYDVLS
jgi:hypothetical protein